MGAHEALEHSEHTAHSHGAKYMGVTMAVFGVLIAFCAAMVGSQRQELMTTLLDQSWAHSSWVAAAVKSGVALSDLQKMRGQANPAALPRLLQFDADYATEADLAKKWDDACEPLVDAHYDAAEGYEHAQLVAELALIIASVGILLNSRPVWLISLVVGAVCLVLIGYTFVSARGEIAEAHTKVHAAEHAYEEYSENDLDSKGREELLNEVDPGGAVRATLQKHEPAAHGDGAAHGQGEGAAAPPHGASPAASAAAPAKPEEHKTDKPKTKKDNEKEDDDE